MNEIQLKDAKATLSAVVDQAVHGDPSIIARHGKRQAVVLSFEEYEKLANIPSFGRSVAEEAGPLRGEVFVGNGEGGVVLHVVVK